MFHFPGCPPHELWIHSWVTGHCPGRVPPFGNSRINVYLQLPSTYRSLSRPSSAISALASTLRSFSLDLASTIVPFLRLLRWNDNLICEFPQHPPLTGIFRERCFNSECLPVQFSRCEKCPKTLVCRFYKKPGGLKWTRTTDLTLIRRVL